VIGALPVYICFGALDGGDDGRRASALPRA
jgi:hypothetical protein